MPLLTLWFDERGRPVVDLHVSPSIAYAAALREQDQTVPPPRPIRALVDTGASMTKVTQSILDALELPPVGTIDEHTASTEGAPVQRIVYAVCLFMSGVYQGLLATDHKVSSASDLSGLGVQALLGRDLLARFHLFYNGPEQHIAVAFDPPPTE